MNGSAPVERGVVAVYVCITFVVIMGFGAMGVDLGYWYYQGWRQQQAVDQAALAGAVFLPDRPDLARAAALESASQNGYAADVVVAIGSARNANRITVTIGRDHNSLLAGVAAKKFQNIQRSSSAEYIPPVSLGSPYARIGNDPEDSGPSFNYWLNQHGPWVYKHNGDRFASDLCDPDNSVAHPTPYNCTPSAQVRGNNPDYARIGQFGYRFAVDVTNPPAGKDLTFEVFDPVTTNTGQQCPEIATPTERQALSAWVADADLRYRSWSEGAQQWCGGELTNMSGSAARDRQYMDTEFAVYASGRSVASGAMVPATAPPTTLPPAMPTTTLGPGGGGTVAAPCAPTPPTGGVSVTVRNDRATPTQIYWVDTSCQEQLIGTIAAGGTYTIPIAYTGYRYRFWDATSRAFINEQTTPAPVSGYALRSLENSGTPNSYARANASTLTVEDAATVSTSEASWELTPALNGNPACVSFRSSVNAWFLTASGGGAVSLNVAPAAANASWCITGSATGMPTVRLSPASDLTQFLMRNATGQLVTSMFPPSWSMAEWYVTMPLLVRMGEPMISGANVTLYHRANGRCLETSSFTAPAGVLLNPCATNPIQQFKLTPTGARSTIDQWGTTNALGPAGGVNVAGTLYATQMAAPFGAVIPHLVQSAGRGAFTFSPDTGTVFLGNGGVAGTTSARVTAGVGPNTAFTIRVGGLGQIVPVPVSAASAYSFAVHLPNVGSCSVSGANASITVTNSGTDDVGVYALDAACRELYIGPISAGGSAVYSSVKVGQRMRFYRETTLSLVRDRAVAAVTDAYALPANGPAPTCSPPVGGSGQINFSSTRAAPVRIVAVDVNCFENTIATIATGGSHLASTYPGAIWRTIDTYTGAVLNTYTATTGVLAATEADGSPTSGNCSAASGAASALTVTNNRTAALRIMRVDGSCTEQPAATLAAGANTVLSTFVGERWKVYDGTSLVADLTIANPTEAITVDPVATWTWDPNAASVTGGGTVLVCRRVETAYPLTRYTSTDNHSGTLYQLINPRDGVHDDGVGNRDVFAENFTTGFRRWRQYCKIPAAQVQAGRYTITVRTNLNDDSAGVNSYSLRTVWTGSTPADRSEAGIVTSALENFPVFVNINGMLSSTLHMARILPIHAGRTLRIQLYDTGDTSSGTVNLRINPPADSNVATFTCAISVKSQDGTFPPASATPSTCSISGLARYDYNGTVTEFDVAIPSNYTCDPTVATNCWVTVTVTPSGTGGQLNDRTTWSATILGDPLRIVR